MISRSPRGDPLNRRGALKLAAWGLSAQVFSELACTEARPISVIDTHIHLFDPRRPGGVPWPQESDVAIYKPALPARYVNLSAPFGVVGAIAIECSPLESDNEWLLNIVESNPVMMGAVGDLVPGAANYLAELQKLQANPLFLGIRYGNLWGRELAVDIEKPGFIDGLKELAKAGLVLDSANPDTTLIGALRKVSERVPELRIVIDHLPHATMQIQRAARDDPWADLRALAQSPRVFAKLSEIPQRENGELLTDPSLYRDRLDVLWELFGEDRVLFGSDWPNSDHVASYAQTFAIVRGYIDEKSPEARRKFFWRNSISAYRWKPRSQEQHS
jgi:L-fuconolactonase